MFISRISEQIIHSLQANKDANICINLPLIINLFR